MKYVIFVSYGHYVPVLLPEKTMAHADVNRGSYRVHSAGFCSVKPDGSVTVWGESETLRIGMGRNDAAVIEAFLRDEPPLVVNAVERPKETAGG